MWTLRDSGLGCVQVAHRFALSAFEGKRVVDVASVHGTWIGRTFSGSFKLCGGVRVYDLVCVDGVWSVAV
jgi:hypothetical protein